MLINIAQKLRNVVKMSVNVDNRFINASKCFEILKLFSKLCENIVSEC